MLSLRQHLRHQLPQHIRTWLAQRKWSTDCQSFLNHIDPTVRWSHLNHIRDCESVVLGQLKTSPAVYRRTSPWANGTGLIQNLAYCMVAWLLHSQSPYHMYRCARHSCISKPYSSYYLIFRPWVMSRKRLGLSNPLIVHNNLRIPFLRFVQSNTILVDIN